MIRSHNHYAHHLNVLRDELVEFANKGSISGAVDLATRLIETAGLIAGIASARRAHDCCEQCATVNGVSTTVEAAKRVFDSYIKGSASQAAKKLGLPDPYPTGHAQEPRQARTSHTETAGETPASRKQPEGGPDIIAALQALGLTVTHIQANSPLEALLMAMGHPLPPGVADALQTAQQHAPECACDACLVFWAYAGPDFAGGGYGPFSRAQVNAKQRELGLEETPAGRALNS